jgi:hypothetical protein
VKLVIRKIEWKKYFNANDNSLWVSLGDDWVIDKQVTSKDGSWTPTQFSTTLRNVRLSDAQKIEVQIHWPGRWYSSAIDCRCEPFTGTLSQMNGLPLALRQGSYEILVILGVEGLPQLPELPDWKK